MFRIEEGSPWPQGTLVERGGVNFALFSMRATGVELCLFDSPEDTVPSQVARMRGPDRFVWHCFVPGCEPGQLYLYRVNGPWNPAKGLRFNPHKYLLDPYARAITGKYRWGLGEQHAYDDSVPDGTAISTTSNIEGCPRCVVTGGAFDWGGDRRPHHPMNQTVIYEMHMKGFTRHPSSGVSSPGAYLGAIEKIPYLKSLGVTTVELLPIHESVTDEFLIGRGLTNYWGYNTIGFFAPDSRFRSGSGPADQVIEFKKMVRAFHEAGIEVILDVVYNHTGEGDHRGPSLCFRGVDNASYYHLKPDDRSRYVDYTGCGNTFNFDSPQVVKFVMDSLRYWVSEMHVDGFRFDLASAMGRQNSRFNRVSSFFVAIHQDPVLSKVKLIAEPWDVAADDSYQVGNFPEDWAEWNGRFRDTMRKFIKGDAGMVGDLGCRLTGSADLYGKDGRSPSHSINFITCHDGFTLRDLVSFSEKHNEANGESNADGNDSNDSFNCGVEGATGDPAVESLRRRQAKNLLFALVVSRGVPMLLAGDEFLRTQGGNNNAYCLDSETTWLDWGLMETERDRFTRFTRMLLAFRREHPALHGRSFFTGKAAAGGEPDIEWFWPEGEQDGWHDERSRAIAFRLGGGAADTGEIDSDIFAILNASGKGEYVRLPAPPSQTAWHRVADTSLEDGRDILEPGGYVPIDPPAGYLVNARSCVLLIAKPQQRPEAA